jgi:hypothetical protein
VKITATSSWSLLYESTCSEIPNAMILVPPKYTVEYGGSGADVSSLVTMVTSKPA